LLLLDEKQEERRVTWFLGLAGCLLAGAIEASQQNTPQSEERVGA